MNPATILIVDDEPAVRSFLRDVLVEEHRRVVSVESAEEALKGIGAEEFDLVLLDLRLKGAGGMVVLDELHARWPDTAVIVLTAHATMETAIEALRRGAHDYLFKPCTVVELRESARSALRERQRKLRQRELLAELRRSLGDSLEQLDGLDVGQLPLRPFSADIPWEDGRFQRHADLIVDLTRHRITLGGHLLELSPTEFDLLAYMVTEAPRVVSPRELVRAVQGYDCAPEEARDIARSHIYNIRQKIKDLTDGRDVVRTVRGVGYTLWTLTG